MSIPRSSARLAVLAVCFLPLATACARSDELTTPTTSPSTTAAPSSTVAPTTAAPTVTDGPS